MRSTNEIDQEINTIGTLGEFVQTYEEIYTAKLQEIRTWVLKTRNFMLELSEIFHELKILYQTAPETAKESSETNSYFSIFEKTKEKVAVFLSTSELFSREINYKVFPIFLEYIQKTNCDIVIAGRIGKELYEQRKIPQLYKYFDLPEEITNESQIEPMINHLIRYKSVNIFHGKFINLIQQTACQSNISGDVSTSDKKEAVKKPPKVKYLFEPSLEEILAFFEKQIFISLLKQASNESRLAQIGSRITALHEASDNVEEKLKDLKFLKIKLAKSEEDKKQRQRFAGISLWQKQ